MTTGRSNWCAPSCWGLEGGPVASRVPRPLCNGLLLLCLVVCAWTIVWKMALVMHKGGRGRKASAFLYPPPSNPPPCCCIDAGCSTTRVGAM